MSEKCKTYLNTIAEEIDNSKATKDKTVHISNAISWLLERIDLSDDILNSYDKRDRNELFSYFCSFAELLQGLFKKVNEKWDLRIEEDESEKALILAISDIARTKGKLEKIEKDKTDFEETNADLLKKEKELNKKDDEYQKLKQKVTSLKEIKATVSEEVIKSLESEIEELNKTIKHNRKVKDDLDTQIKKLKNTHQDLSASVAKADAEEKAIKENITDTINAKADIIKEILAKHSRNLDSIMAEIENYKRQYSQLPDELKNAKEELDIYSLHFGENSNIVNALKECGVSSIDDFFSEIKHHEGTIKAELNRFDGMLKEVIEKQEEASEEIKRRIRH